MPVQSNASLAIIQNANACFSTIRFAPGCEATHYQYNLAFENGRMPSIYFGDNPAASNDSVRLRPLHSRGFRAFGAETRLYLAVAGLTDEIGSLRTALTTDMAQVAGRLYQSRYYAFCRLGVDRDTIQAALAAMIAQAVPLTSAELVTANTERNAPAATAFAYVTDAPLLGTFWASKAPHWGDTDEDPSNGFYRPFQLFDFAIDGDQIETAQGDDMAAALALIPGDWGNIHSGDALITPAGSEAYYGTQAYSDGSGGMIPGTTIWARLQRLGAYRQYYSLAANGTTANQYEVLPDNSIFRKSMFSYYPFHDRDLTSAEQQALQLPAIANMISNFTDI